MPSTNPFPQPERWCGTGSVGRMAIRARSPATDLNPLFTLPACLLFVLHGFQAQILRQEYGWRSELRSRAGFQGAVSALLPWLSLYPFRRSFLPA